MKTPGRPKKNGQKPMWMLKRETLVIRSYGRAREAREKHSAAITEAVKYIRDTAPTMPISETEVKRIVTVWRSKRRRTCLFVSKPNPEHSIIAVPGRDGRIVYARIVYTASVGPHPIYPRANAAEKPSEISTDR
jgi:hypothetical protein